MPCLYALAGIAPPHIRRKVAANADRCLQEDDPRHPLHGQRPAKHRLPSRNSFLDSTEALNTSKQDARTTLWVDEWNVLSGVTEGSSHMNILPAAQTNPGPLGGAWIGWECRKDVVGLWWKCGSSHIQMYVTVGRYRLCLILWHVVMHPTARGQTWLLQPLPVSTVPNTERNQSDSGFRGLDEEDYGPIPYTLKMVAMLYGMKHCSCHKLVVILTGTGGRKACEVANRAWQVVQVIQKNGLRSHLHPCPIQFHPIGNNDHWLSCYCRL